MGFIMVALGRGAWYATIQTIFNILHVFLIWGGLLLFGLEGVAIAFFLLYLVSSMVNLIVFYSITGFRWSESTRQLLLLLLPVAFLAFVIGRSLPILPATGLGLTVSIVAFFLCARELTRRIGLEHKIVRGLMRIPGMRRACNAQS